MSTNHHEIVTKSDCRLGRVQIEDWSKVYPGLQKTYTVALYATLQATPHYRPTFLYGGESARFAFNFATMAEARDCYLCMCDGCDPHDWADALDMGNPYWNDGDTAMCLPH
jgi:hypothetical protein